ncbi:MAG: hypothetical protein HYU56_05490 [Candidatus Aenigmarchaeota archaeon]|nr:hypothetical protein [Candidatus Aenigmarchaeota archaeon]
MADYKIRNPIKWYDYFPCVGFVDAVLFRRQQFDDFFGKDTYKPKSVWPAVFLVYQAVSSPLTVAAIIEKFY